MIRPKRGGKREGSGRKPSGKAPILLRLPKPMVEALQASGEQSEIVERELEGWMRSHIPPNTGLVE